jgi:hypothetical protein
MSDSNSQPDQLQIEYREDVERIVDRGRQAARSIQIIALVVFGLVVIGAVGTEVAFAIQNPSLALVSFAGLLIVLPFLLLIPAAGYGLGVLLQIQASRLDIAMIESDLGGEDDTQASSR